MFDVAVAGVLGIPAAAAGVAGQVRVRNNNGATDLVVDLVGYSLP